MQNHSTTLGDLIAATRNAKSRTGNRHLGNEVQRGQFRVVSVTYAPNGKSIVTPLTGWLALAETIQTLNSLQP